MSRYRIGHSVQLCLVTFVTCSVLSACGSGGNGNAAEPLIKAPHGELHGRLVLAFPGHSTGVGGIVQFQDNSRVIYEARAKSNGDFSKSLPVGSYEVTGNSPKFDSGKSTCYCNQHTALQVSTDSNSYIEVICSTS